MIVEKVSIQVFVCTVGPTWYLLWPPVVDGFRFPFHAYCMHYQPFHKKEPPQETRPEKTRENKKLRIGYTIISVEHTTHRDISWGIEIREHRYTTVELVWKKNQPEISEGVVNSEAVILDLYGIHNST